MLKSIVFESPQRMSWVCNSIVYTLYSIVAGNVGDQKNSFQVINVRL